MTASENQQPKPRRYKPSQPYEMGEIVYREGVGFGSTVQYGAVIGHDFFGAAIIDWR